MTDLKAFKPAREHCGHTGKVIFQNELLQLVQYKPQHTDRAPATVPVRLALDQQVLHHGHATQEPMVKWMVDQGFTVS